MLKKMEQVFILRNHSFADGVANNLITVGVLSTTTFVANDRITFKVTQIGSTIAGKGVRFMLKCKV